MNRNRPTLKNNRKPTPSSKTDTDPALSSTGIRGVAYAVDCRKLVTITNVKPSYFARWISRTLNGDGSFVITTHSLHSIVCWPSGGRMSKFWASPVTNKNSSWRASSSPRHDLLPAPQTTRKWTHAVWISQSLALSDGVLPTLCSANGHHQVFFIQ